MILYKKHTHPPLFLCVPCVYTIFFIPSLNDWISFLLTWVLYILKSSQAKLSFLILLTTILIFLFTAAAEQQGLLVLQSRYGGTNTTNSSIVAYWCWIGLGFSHVRLEWWWWCHEKNLRSSVMYFPRSTGIILSLPSRYFGEMSRLVRRQGRN